MRGCSPVIARNCATPLDPSPPADMRWSSRFETGTVAKPPVLGGRRRHEEVAVGQIFVSGFKAKDTKIE